MSTIVESPRSVKPWSRKSAWPTGDWLDTKRNLGVDDGVDRAVARVANAVEQLLVDDDDAQLALEFDDSIPVVALLASGAATPSTTPGEFLAIREVPVGGTDRDRVSLRRKS